uniref:Aluminum-activated malate transporter n=1 Tax=Gossypium raimondii TaxID=29730 RepID=A0A0D2Q3P2_GOSRA|nr:hypothetical protein B456_008G286300 [Gossypium raimondii]
MAAKLGSFRHSLLERREKTKGYSVLGLTNEEEELQQQRCRWYSYRFISEKVTGFLKEVQYVAGQAWQMGISDPRKIVFSAKMGLALALISLLIFLKEEPIKELSQYSVWAILTVVVVFEFSIGATLSKGFNRGLGTLSAGGLALAVAELSELAGQWEEIVVVISIFITGCVKGYLNCVEYERVPSRILTYQASDDPVYNGYRSAVESTSQEEALLGFAIWEPPHGPYKSLGYPWKNYARLSGALRHCAFMVMALHGCILSEIQAPPERRRVFYHELQRVGATGARLLCELGDKVKKMEKLGSRDMLFDVLGAAEELQNKVDRKSYLLVNAESWEIGNRPHSPVEPQDSRNSDNEEHKVLVYKSLSEAVLDLKSVPIPNSWDGQQTNVGVRPSVSPVVPSNDLLKKQISWPAPRSFTTDTSPPLEESKTYENASALSLATFTSLLIEFVARLENVVDSFEELSEKANFKEPEELPAAAREPIGFWSRLFRWKWYRPGA